MQELFLVAVSLLALLFAAGVLSSRSRGPNGLTLVVAGVVPGVLGAILVLVPRLDLIPDDLEPVLWMLAIGLLMVAALAAVLLRRVEL